MTQKDYNLELSKTVLKVETACLTTSNLCLLFDLIISDYKYYKTNHDGISKIVSK